jgi:hypothetical protein
MIGNVIGREMEGVDSERVAGQKSLTLKELGGLTVGWELTSRSSPTVGERSSMKSTASTEAKGIRQGWRKKTNSKWGRGRQSSCNS